MRVGLGLCTPNSVAHHHAVVCFTADVQQQHFVVPRENFFPIFVFVTFVCCSHVFLLSLLVAADRMRHDMDQVGDIVFCSTIGAPNIEFLTNWKQ